MADDNLGAGAEDLSNSFGDLQERLKSVAASLGKAAELTGDLADEMNRVAKTTDDIEDKQKKVNSETDKFGKKLQAIGKGAALGIVNAMANADQEITNMGKNLNLSRAEATQLKAELAKVSQNLGDARINSIKLAEAQDAINKQLGTSIKFSGETLGTFSRLTKVVKLSEDSATGLALAAQMSGENFEDVVKETLATSRAMQQSRGIALNTRDILDETGKITGFLRANLEANPRALTKAVTAAKLLGAEMSDIRDTANSLLNFESSIEAELEAELLTGRQINLEKARSFALARDFEGLAEEIRRQLPDIRELGDMNAIEAESLAKAFGMTADQLADILFKQEGLNNNTQEMVTLSGEEILNRQEQLSLSETAQMGAENATAKAGENLLLFEDSVAATQAMAENLAGSAQVMTGLNVIASSLAITSQAMALYAQREAIAKIFSANAMKGIVGLAIAGGIIAALYAALSSADSDTSSATNLAEGGIVMPRPGGTIARIGEAGQPEAVIPLNKAKQMGFSGNDNNTQPIIIQNNWDAFAASNGNGRRGLGGTQNLQATPTFA